MFLRIPFFWVLIAKKKDTHLYLIFGCMLPLIVFGGFFLLVFFIRDKGISAICRGVFNEMFSSPYFFLNIALHYILNNVYIYLN